MAFSRDFQWTSYDDCREVQKPTPSAEHDVDMDTFQDFDDYSESLASSSSFPFSSTSGSTGTTCTSSFASDVSHPISSEQIPGIIAMEDFAAPQQGQNRAHGRGCGVVEGCIDPRLFVQGSLSSEHREAPGRWRWGGRDQVPYDEKVIQKPDVDASLPPLQDARQDTTNEFDIAFEETNFTTTEPDLANRMWLRTWMVTNPDRFPNKVELESLKTLSGLSESEITAWLSQHFSVPIVPESEVIVIDAEHTPRQHCTPRYRPKCCRSQRRFRYIAETRDETRVLECTHGCGQSFDVTGQWTRHERYNIEEWKCHKCKFISPRKDKLLKHLRQHHSFHGAITKSHCRQLLQPEVRPCGFCLRQFDNWSEWLNHVAAHFQGRILGGPWTMARWNRAVDESFDLDDDEDDDDDDDDDDQGHDDEDESSPDYESSTADDASNSSTKANGAPSGGGSKGSFKSPGNSRYGPASTRNSGACKKASGESLHREYDYRIIESEDSYPFRYLDDEDSYYGHKSSKHFARATDDESTFPTLCIDLTSVTLEDYSGWHLPLVVDKGPREDLITAIVGLSGRFRGSVSHEPFWDILGRGPDTSQQVPADRFSIDPRIDIPSNERGSFPTRFGNLIHNAGLFDVGSLDISLQEQFEMDITPKLFFETVSEAMDLGGIPTKLSNEKGRAASRYHRCTYCRTKRRFEPERKQHMEKYHCWRCHYEQESSNVFGNPEEVLHRPSIYHLPSGKSSTSSNMESSRSTLKGIRPTTQHRKTRLLCLDGGGVRGLSSLILLERLTSIVNQQANCGAPGLDPQKIFSTVVGTSTGGLLALMMCKFASTLRHLYDLGDEGPRSAANLTDLSPPDKLRLSGWHQHIKPQNILICHGRPEIYLHRPIIDPDTLEALYCVEKNRHLDDGSEPYTYLDWMRNWWRAHNMGLRHYIRHGIWPVEYEWVVDDAGGGKVDLIYANISDLNPRDLESMVLSTGLLSTQSTGLSGLVRQSGDTSRSTSQRPQRKTTFCSMCKNHPQGFHGHHELRRHVDRNHTSCGICIDETATSAACPAVPLWASKTYQNQKTHGANYNAAAHLRRAHFHPCKNKRGGYGKVIKGRGGKGGGNEPPMDELKNRMWEKVEVNVTDMQGTAPELTHFKPREKTTGASPPKATSSPTFDTIRRLRGDGQNPTQFARYKIERFLNERDGEDCAWRSVVENSAMDAVLQDTSPGAVLGAKGGIFLDDDRDSQIATHQETRRPSTTSADFYRNEGFASSLGILGGSRRGRKKQRREEPSKWPI